MGRCLQHELQVKRVAGALNVSFHCTVAAETSIVQAHELTERMEKALRARVPNLGRIVIHIEPEGA